MILFAAGISLAWQREGTLDDAEEVKRRLREWLKSEKDK